MTDRVGSAYYRLARRLAKAAPGLVSRVGRVSDVALAGVLRPLVPVPPPARTYDTARLEALTDSLNEAAESYFASPPPEFERYLLDKPYSGVDDFATQLFNVGTMAHWLRLRPDDVVLELGAGSAWVSHFFNLFGCRTIALDVSASAVGIARRLFEQSNRTNWDKQPQFLSYDGRRLPVDDASCDRIVIHDAFHHIPNQREILTEMARVLRDGGMVAMSEPGRRHSLSEQSTREVEESGVLENDIVVEDLAALAVECGFTRTTVVPLTLKGSVEIDADRFVPFVRGAHFSGYWTEQAQWLLNGHFILLYKGEPRPDSRRPNELRATITPQTDGRVVVEVGEGARVSCTVVNTGDTLWRTDANGEYGATRLGVRRIGADGTVIDADWHRVRLPGEVEPGQRVTLDVELPAVNEPGIHHLVLDMVAEHVGWFADGGSSTTSLSLEVCDPA